MSTESLNLALAVSAVVTGLATVVVAFFSVGTLRLFQLEKNREGAQWTRLVAHLARLDTELHVMVEEAEAASSKGGGPRPELLQERADAYLSQVQQSWQYAAALGVAPVLAHLHVAEVSLHYMQDSLGELRSFFKNPAGPNFAKIRELVEGPMLKHLTNAAASVSNAYAAIPERRRRLSGKDYGLLLDEAAGALNIGDSSGGSDP